MSQTDYYGSQYEAPCACDDACNHRREARFRGGQLDQVQRRLAKILGSGDETDLWTLLDMVEERANRSQSRSPEPRRS